jgi:hypothetical protein
MGTILLFRPHCEDGQRERGSGPRNADAPSAEVIVFPRMSLKYLCQIAEAMDATRARLHILQTTAP